MVASDERPRPGPPRDKNAAKGELVKDWRVVIKWLTPLLAIFVFFGVVYAAGRRDDRASRDVPALEADRHALLAELAKVAARARKGENGSFLAPRGAKSAVRRETELMHQLADVYRSLDEVRAREALAAACAEGSPSTATKGA